MIRRVTSSSAWFARAGFTDAGGSARFAESAELEGLAEPDGSLLRGIAATASPDLAIRALVRFIESAGRSADLDRLLSRESSRRARLLGVLGESATLGDHLARHPEHLRAVTDAVPMGPAERVAHLTRAVSASERGDVSAFDALRIGYREQLLGILAADVTSAEPTETLPGTAAALADLAGAALEAALLIAQEEHPQAATKTRLAVIAMGKCGGRELNYISDVDVIFVAEPPEPSARVSEEDSIEAATQLASTLMRACASHTAEGALWQVDPALRPEGKQGPLVRTVASHQRYYTRWAKTWEFQALLKARHIAGDPEVGAAYIEAISPFVWEAAGRENFVTDVQAMRTRVEKHIPPSEVDRQLKLGPGGLRDVEFSVQLLQLVHGRLDPELRSPNTLKALKALSAGGYVGRDDAAALSEAYRFLRSVEHRVQFFKMKRTHLMPTAEADLHRLGRSLHYAPGDATPAEALVGRWQEHKRTVRQIHKLLFYRPLLSAVASLSPDEARLTPDAAKARLAALGFRDPNAALRHMEALTSGVSRTAAIQRTLLPVMLGWFAEEVDPDAGLLAFRRISESLGRTPWYLKMLRDEGEAAHRLAMVLARSRYAVTLLEQAPEAAQILADGDDVKPRDHDSVLATMRAALRRYPDPSEAMHAARVIRRTELFRTALADLVRTIDADEAMIGLTALNDAMIQSTLDIANRTYEESNGGLPVDITIIAMGRLGGRECGYGSDADVIAVHRAREGVAEDVAAAAAKEIIQHMRSLLRAPGPDPTLGFDMDLRPEGKAGPLSRTVEGYAAYFSRWAVTWEQQALLRARPCAGDEDLGAEFMLLVNALRWPADGLTETQVKEVRRLKARMEGERLPRGADPKRHFKLGRGGLSDVEWTVQLAQMRHAHEYPGLRTTRTLDALRVCVEVGLIEQDDAVALAEAWETATLMRDAVLLWRGRPSDSVPADIRDGEAVARILGWGPGNGAMVVERYLKLARHAREVMSRLFYGQEDSTW
ncbi:MAG: bifunctional [glutamine synthetase] adenylyltransferase/[glutamine synthetase]-adenylyl-L-tyrosine phosphorylase [Dermatophilus congolensis]|nr:bifunctional [glutamine synthetase] adenylyltransferase/[glutamine synthetase]-adenylyl-L-tyrosine phosphorylase [Dermatophilus congolensis]